MFLFCGLSRPPRGVNNSPSSEAETEVAGLRSHDREELPGGETTSRGYGSTMSIAVEDDVEVLDFCSGCNLRLHGCHHA